MKKIVLMIVGVVGCLCTSMQAINVRPQRPAPKPAPVQTMPVVELPVRPVIVPEVEQPVVAVPVIEQPAQPEMPVAVVEPEVTMPEIPANATPEQKKGILAQMKGKARAGYDTAKKWVGAHKKEVAAAVGVGAAVAGAVVATRQYKKGQQGQPEPETVWPYPIEVEKELVGAVTAMKAALDREELNIVFEALLPEVRADAGIQAAYRAIRNELPGSGENILEVGSERSEARRMLKEAFEKEKED